MRKILLTTFGSFGDLHPYIAMARVLLANGDDVTVATHVEYQDQVERIGARFVPLKPGLEEVGPQETWSTKANSPIRGTEFILRTLIMPYLESNYRVMKEAAVGQDLIISHVLCFTTSMISEELGIPWISSILQPAIFFSAYDPPALGFATFLPKMKFLGPTFMRWFLRMMAKPTRSWLNPLDTFRAGLGLPRNAKNVLIDGLSPFGTIALFPPAFAPAQPDWPSNVKQIGFPLFDEETTSLISPGLQTFLDSGSPPIVFTLGTAIVLMATPYFEMAYQAVKMRGLRAVFLVGKKPLRIPSAAMTDPTIHVSSYEPFSGLFPRAAVIVHQCGIGTTAQALASGRPQVLVPFAHDQPDNARRVVELGTGLSIPSSRLTVKRLCAALECLTQSKEFAARAQEIAGQLNVGEFDQKLLDAISHFLNERNSIPA